MILLLCELLLKPKASYRISSWLEIGNGWRLAMNCSSANSEARVIGSASDGSMLFLVLKLKTKIT